MTGFGIKVSMHARYFYKLKKSLKTSYIFFSEVCMNPVYDVPIIEITELKMYGAKSIIKSNQCIKKILDMKWTAQLQWSLC